ncbi:hypothetical protein DM860_014809 [Cuscuta australis]|uniref:cytokinin riboside 5'-monophosphate phosphoribohydrolase n=1 Tax=Cuscuta australis TaxID=267555 RepID=A0A328D4W8_9ASTE|nr:hypothetical protein DM860_014809 [Cuscuta australis]
MQGTSRTLPHTIKSIGLLGSHALGGNPEFMGHIATRGVYGPTYSVEYTVSSTYCKYFEMNHVVEAFIVHPKGVDTIEGLFILISWASEGLHCRPIGLLNIDGYFNSLIKFLDDAVRQNFMASSQRKLFISSFFIGVTASHFVLCCHHVKIFHINRVYERVNHLNDLSC